MDVLRARKNRNPALPIWPLFSPIIHPTEDPCPPSPSFACDFEDSAISGFLNSTGGDFQWWRHKGKTKTDGSGPSVDHTSQSKNGYYSYIETNRLGKREGGWWWWGWCGCRRRRRRQQCIDYAINGAGVSVCVMHPCLCGSKRWWLSYRTRRQLCSLSRLS